MDDYDACFADQATLETVQTQKSDAQSFGLTGTPSFLFNGVPLSGGAPSDIDGWRSVIDAQLEQIAGTATPEGTATAGTDGNGAEATATATP